MKAAAAALVLTFGLAAPASAQMPWHDRGYVNVNVGFQTQSRDVQTSSEFPLYDETASVTATQKVGGGPLFDASGGYRVWRNLAVGLGFSVFSDSSDAAVTAIIPDPAVFDRFVTQTAAASGLKHTETAVHIQAAWMIPVTDKIDVALVGGPSIFSVKQEIVNSVTVVGQSTNLSGVEVVKQSKSVAGANFGVDVTYLVRKRWGVGAFMRFAGASVDLPSVQNLKVGGFQIGMGGRYRF